MEKSEFFSYSWHIDEDETNVTVIRIYGLNSNNENVCVIVKNFLPYFYIELPNHINWDNAKASLLTNKINTIMGEQRPVTYELVLKKKLYYANVDKNKNRKLFPYLRCCCSCVEDIKQISFKIRRSMNVYGIGEINLKMHEHNANPILQLTSLTKIPTAGWISFVGKKVHPEEQVTYCHHEYIVKWENLTEKSSNLFARPLLMGYDIEVNSSIPSSMPNAARTNDKIFQVSCVLGRQGSKPDTYEKYLITLGEPDLKTLGDNIEVIMCSTEEEILDSFIQILKEKQPNIIIGYNIFTFDIPYMIERSKILLYANFNKQGMDKYGRAKERTIEWSSSAYKNQSFQFLDAEGRIFVDLLPLVKRDYKMNNYKLKTISSYFLKDMTKDPLDAKAIFKCYRLGMQGGEKGNKAMAIVGKYCVKDSELVVRLFETLTTWFALCEMSKVTNVPIFQLYTQGQQLKLFSQAYKKCTHDNMILEKDAYVIKDSDHYVGATVFPPVPGVYENVVPFDFSSLYPTTIIAYNISWDTLVEDDTISDDLCHVMEWEDHIGCPHDPKEIRKTELNNIIKEKDAEVKKLREQRDLKKNKDNKEEIKQKIEEIKIQTKPYREERSQLNKSKPKHIICFKRKYRWVKSPMGVLPEILTHLLDTRALTKKEMKTIKGKLKNLSETSDEYIQLSTYLDVLDQRQLALKVSANSGYGCLGVRRGYLPLMPGAMCTTYMGRQAILKAAGSIQKDWGGVLIYGDTDSNYCNFPHIKNIPETWDHCLKVAKEVSNLFPKPMNLAFEEKVYAKFMLLTKKRYMSIACERDGVLDTKISKKGVLLQRRDTCSYVRKIYGDVVMMIFEKKNLEDILYYIIGEINKLCGRFYPVSEFIITKSIGDVSDMIPVEGKDKNGKICYKIGDYKIKPLPKEAQKREQQFKLKKCETEEEYYLRSLPSQVQLAEKMRARGQLVAAGSRIEYVITTQGGHLAKQYEKVESADYFARHGETLEIDFLYYLKQLSNPLDQILDIIFGDKDINGYKFSKNFTLQQYKYRIYMKEKVLGEFKNLFLPIIKFDK